MADVGGSGAGNGAESLRDSQALLHQILRDSRTEGHLGPGPVDDHIAHARALIAALPHQATSFMDLGSGGGIPGLVIAVECSSISGVLLDGSTRRGAFLERAVHRLGLDDRVQVVVDRAENVGRMAAWRGVSDVVVARSFGPPAVVAECAAPLLRVGGVLIVSDPPSEYYHVDRWPRDGLALLGMRVARQEVGPPAYTVLDQATICPDKFPRRTGIPTKRPLF